jgi:hypothetical protein
MDENKNLSLTLAIGAMVSEVQNETLVHLINFGSRGTAKWL